jgi:tol-pal system protein YbgF
MRKGRIVPTLLVLAALAAAGPAVSQTPMDDPLDARDAKRVDRMEKVVRELRSIVFQLRDTGKPVVVQPADTDARLADLTARIGDLEQSLQRVNGLLESTAHELALEKRENERLRQDLQALSDRVAAAEQGAVPGAAPPVFEGGGTAAVAPAPGDPAKDFAEARQLMLAGDYDSAQAAFAAFVQTWPDDPKAPEASYWWGKTLSVRGANADAAKAYIGAIRGWPKTPWAPDAVVELARSLVALKKPADACQTLAELAKRYPKAPPTVTSRAAAARAPANCAG